MNNKFAVTVGRAEDEILLQQAKAWAQGFGVPYIERKSKGSLDFLRKEYGLDALLIATRQGAQVFNECGTFFFHPSMAVLRLQRIKNGENDHFLTSVGAKEGMKILDCTLGLASDAAIASFAVGASGKVVGVEASPLLHFVVSRGLQEYVAQDEDLNAAMRRISTVGTDAESYLKTLVQDSFDVVYFDPMFRYEVGGSSNMQPLRPLAYKGFLTEEVILEALKVAPKVVIKERTENILKEFGCTEILGGKYSKVKFGIRRRQNET